MNKGLCHIDGNIHRKNLYRVSERVFVEHFPYGKQIGKILDMQNMQKRPQAPKPIFLGQESGKSGNQVPFFGKLGKYLKFAHEISVQDGSDAFPNELMRFRIEAKPIWEKTQKQCQNAVVI